MRVKRPVDAWESSEGRISVFEPPPSQTPNPKHQRSSKSQAPNPKNRCRGKRRTGRFLSLELGASLELGVWNLELFAWAPCPLPVRGFEALNVCQNPTAVVRYRRNFHDHYVIPPRDAPGGIGWRGAEKMRI